MSIWRALPQLTLTLKQSGLESAWYSILRTRITHCGKEFSYILNDPRLKDAANLDADLLEGLSLGDISVLYEYSLAFINHKNRKDLGQYFTPDDVASFMATQGLKLDHDDAGVWIDPCSGVGNLAFQLASHQKNPETFVASRLFLVDIDPLALFIARVLFTLAFQKRNTNLFNDVATRFVTANFLQNQDLPNFDFAILNPPYVVTEADPRFETSKARDLYAYFIERVVKAAAQGFVSISPQSFTNGSKFHPLRNLLVRQPARIKIYCFDNVPDSIFRGYKFGSKNSNTANSTRAAIIVYKKSSKASHKITPLLRWRSKERAVMFGMIDQFASRVELKPIIFPKLSPDLVDFYGQALQFKPLNTRLSDQKTPYRLFVPSTPRYYISALKRPVSRTSYKTLYFKQKPDMERAYLLLNSSFMYWWWRVNDGGMTISDRTLCALPFKNDFDVDMELISALEKSEHANKVYKLNAGKMIENVKHGLSMIARINMTIAPQYAEALIQTHSNSVIRMKTYA